jgi:hypothetical protein
MSSFGKDYGISVCPECRCIAYINEDNPTHHENQCTSRKKLVRGLTLKGLPKNKVALRKAIKNLQKKKKKLSKTISKNLRASQKPGWHHWALEDKEYDLLHKAYTLVKLKERYMQ